MQLDPTTVASPPPDNHGHASWAHWYAATLGWKVFPCDGKTPKIAGGYLKATDDLEQITAWWEQWPVANIGIACGKSGLVVIDVDPRHNGDDSLLNLEGTHDPLPATAVVVSGGADHGTHRYFTIPEGCDEPATRTPASGIDVRAGGAYVIAPPSVHPVTRARYSWKHAPFEFGVAPCPDWVLALVGTRTPSINPDIDSGLDQPFLGSEKLEAGRRNVGLTSLAGKLRRQGFGFQAINSMLQVENLTLCEPPLERTAVERIAQSIARYAVPRTSGEPCTDVGNAHRFLTQFGHLVRFDTSRGRNGGGAWRVWDGKRWVLDEIGAQNLAHHTVASLRDEAAASTGTQRDVLNKWAKTCETFSRMETFLKSVRTMPGIAIKAEEMDSDPLLLNCQNGVVDLQTGTLLPHDSSRLITKLCPWPYDPDLPTTTPPALKKFLDDILPSPELQELLQQYAGYCLTGLTGVQHFYLLYGTGANGKSTIINLLMGLLGPDYAQRAPQGLLLERHPGQATNDIADLAGIRLLVHSELPDRVRLNLELIKQLTGGDVGIKARHLYAEDVPFTPQLKLLISADRKPLITETHDAIWRRLRLWPFTVRIPDEEQRRNYHVELLEEASHILRWAVDGLLRFHAAGDLPEPDAMTKATAGYRQDADVFSQFLGERCKLIEVKRKDRKPRIKLSDLLSRFKDWLEESNLRTNRYTRLWLKDELTRHKIRIVGPIDGYMWALGIEIADYGREMVLDADEIVT